MTGNGVIEFLFGFGGWFEYLGVAAVSTKPLYITSTATPNRSIIESGATINSPVAS
ncbi:hypothetical protein RIVM261_081390 [Rivularia sp. IAM M-261]|nr:hypothetical protein CAL7716_015670 [Calothrix sp. PCC 7716]GJD23183.1 hypothetical protein RIVM261_081390 [Rivularia sp. IAM M-261]